MNRPFQLVLVLFQPVEDVSYGRLPIPSVLLAFRFDTLQPRLSAGTSARFVEYFYNPGSRLNPPRRLVPDLIIHPCQSLLISPILLDYILHLIFNRPASGVMFLLK